MGRQAPGRHQQPHQTLWAAPSTQHISINRVSCGPACTLCTAISVIKETHQRTITTIANFILRWNWCQACVPESAVSSSRPECSARRATGTYVDWHNPSDYSWRMSERNTSNNPQPRWCDQCCWCYRETSYECGGPPSFDRSSWTEVRNHIGLTFPGVRRPVRPLP